MKICSVTTVCVISRQDGQVEVQKEGPSMAELVTSEDVDILSYISWEKFERVILSVSYSLPLLLIRKSYTVFTPVV